VAREMQIFQEVHASSHRQRSCSNEFINREKGPNQFHVAKPEITYKNYPKMKFDLKLSNLVGLVFDFNI
jgi:hypothetical protein